LPASAALILRFVRFSANRSRIWTMTLRGFSAAGAGADTRRIGGEIFSNVKTGMVNPSTLVTKRPWALVFHPEDFF
jgi:hypothetical protein